ASAAKALAEMLRSKNNGDRKAASDALAEMIRTVFTRQKKSQGESGLEALPQDVVDCAEAVVPVVPSTLKDSLAAVRRNGAEALQNSATAFYELIPEVGTGGVFDPDTMPPSGRPWSPAEQARVKEAQDELDKTEKLFAP